MDDAQILAQVAQLAKLPGANPSMATDPQYWLRRIKETGGLGSDNLEYWKGLGMRPEGAPEGGGPGGGGMPTSGFGAAPNPYQIPTFQTPKPYDAPQFTAPSGLTMANDPGYAARMKMGTDAIQGAAAAKGSLLSGGTLKALERYGQDYGSNEYGKVYDRAANTFGMNAGLGLQGYQMNAANAWKGQELGAQYGLQGYLTNTRTQRDAQSDYWQRLTDLYRGGVSVSGAPYQRP
jgi:hypothetical protein